MKLYGKILYLLLLALVALFFQLILIYFVKDELIFYFLLFIPIMFAMKFYEYLLFRKSKKIKLCVAIIIISLTVAGAVAFSKKTSHLQCDYFWISPFFVEKMPKELSDVCKDVFGEKIKKIEKEMDQ